MCSNYSSGEAAGRENIVATERKLDPAKLRASIVAWRRRDQEWREQRARWRYDHSCAAQVRNRVRHEQMQARMRDECQGALPTRMDDIETLRKRLNQRDHRERGYARRDELRTARGDFTEHDRHRIALGARRLALWIAGQGRGRKALESRQRDVLFAWAVYVKMRRELFVPNGKPPSVGRSKFAERMRKAGREHGERTTRTMLALIRDLEKPGGPLHGIFEFEADELWGIW